MKKLLSVALALLLCFTLTACDGGSIFAAIFGKTPDVPEPPEPEKLTAAVPSVSGKSESEAISALAAAGFTNVITDTVYSLDVPAGIVVSQSVAPDTDYAFASEIVVSISAGVDPDYVPTAVLENFAGQTEAAAVARLADLGFENVVIVNDYSDTVAKDIVISQTPEAGEMTVDNEIKLTVSLGKKPQKPVSAKMPSLVGMTRTAAVKKLKDAGFTNISVKYVESPTGDKGNVTSQSIAAGVNHLFTSKITITVTDGVYGSAIGETFPNFTLELASGATISLFGCRGKIVLINFWGTWCGPCMSEMPDLQRLYEHYNGKVVVIGVNVDGKYDEEGIAQTITDLGLTFPIAYDSFEPNENVYYKTNTGYVPITLLLDAQGVIVCREIGVPAGGAYNFYLNEIEKLK